MRNGLNWTETQRQIATLLAQKKSLEAIIAAGYTSSLVYKVMKASESGDTPEKAHAEVKAKEKAIEQDVEEIKLEKERMANEEAERLAKEKADAEAKAKEEDKEHRLKSEEERKAKEETTKKIEELKSSENPPGDGNVTPTATQLTENGLTMSITLPPVVLTLFDAAKAVKLVDEDEDLDSFLFKCVQERFRLGFKLQLRLIPIGEKEELEQKMQDAAKAGAKQALLESKGVK